MAKPQDASTRMVLKPPSWAFPVGLGSAALALVYFLYRLAAGSGGGLGFLPYALALAAVAVYLLLSARERIEVDDEVIARYRGRRMIGRSPTRDIEDVRAGFLSTCLVFRRGEVIRILDLWESSHLVAAFFRRKIATRNAKERFESEATGGMSGSRSAGAVTARGGRTELARARTGTAARPAWMATRVEPARPPGEARR